MNNSIDHKLNNEMVLPADNCGQEFILRAQLLNLIAEDRYPFHMPGHKRTLSPAPGLPYEWDVTEVEGTDDLHHAEGILREAMERTALLYCSDNSRYLVNGSTVGILASIRAACPHGSEIIAARNCHKSVYNAIELGELKAHFIYPPVDEASGVNGSIPPSEVESMLAQFPKSRAVILTSPTYEGVVSDISAIAGICHAHDIPLIVDEAHGAHLIKGMGTVFPEGAVACGADIVIQSPHKTLPSLTQTAWLHFDGKRVSEKSIDRQLEVFETSSPSYPLLVSLDGCTGIMRSRGQELMTRWENNLARFDQSVRQLKKLRVLCHGEDAKKEHPLFFDFDPGKLFIYMPVTASDASTSGSMPEGVSGGTSAEISGGMLADCLRSRYGIETEMVRGNGVLAMSTVADDSAAFEKLAGALLEIDEMICRGENCFADGGAASIDLSGAFAEGETADAYVYAYPPGIPVFIPGEVITTQHLDTIRELAAKGCKIYISGNSTGREG